MTRWSRPVGFRTDSWNGGLTIFWALAGMGWGMMARAKPTAVWPKHLATYRQCSLKHHLQFRRKARGNFRTTSYLEEGKALHAVMRRWFRTTRDWRTGAGPLVIARWLGEELAEHHYDAPTEHRLALRTVAGHAAWCLGQIPDDVTVRWVERELQTDQLRIGGFPVRFQARVDLVVEHQGGEIEHIDFKVGGPQEDHWIQRGVERLVVGAAHPLVVGRPATRTTTLYAGTREPDSLCHTPESFGATRSELRDLTVRMLTDAAPEPTPSNRCQWCPYRDAGCPVRHDPSVAVHWGAVNPHRSDRVFGYRGGDPGTHCQPIG